jgi:hypothetical protein
VENAEAQSQLQPYLQPGERILWTGQPDARRLFGSKDLYLVPFSLLWGGGTLFWEGGVIWSWLNAPGGAPIFFLFWGIPFVVVGQYLIWGRFIVKRRDRRRTFYAVTNQRVLVLKGRSLQSVFLNQLPSVNQSARADGSGSLEFGPGSGPFGYAIWSDTGMDFFTRGLAPPAFYDIADVNQVHRLIIQARTGAGQ